MGKVIGTDSTYNVVVISGWEWENYVTLRANYLVICKSSEILKTVLIFTCKFAKLSKYLFSTMQFSDVALIN